MCSGTSFGGAIGVIRFFKSEFSSTSIFDFGLSDFLYFSYSAVSFFFLSDLLFIISSSRVAKTWKNNRGNVRNNIRKWFFIYKLLNIFSYEIAFLSFMVISWVTFTNMTLPFILAIIKQKPGLQDLTLIFFSVLKI